MIQHSSALEAAIAWLIGQRIIRDQSDVIEATGEHKGNFSEYKSGKKTPSANFVLRFKQKYKLDLEDFEDGKWPNSDDAPQSQLTIETKLEVLLEFLIRLQREEYDGKNEKEIIESWQKECISKIAERKMGTRGGAGNRGKK